MLNCICGAVLACAVNLDYRGVSAEGAARGECMSVGSWTGSRALGAKLERAGDSWEIFTFNLFASFPSKSADIWKRGIIVICLFQQVPPLPCAAPGSPWLCRAVGGPGMVEGTDQGGRGR